MERKNSDIVLSSIKEHKLADFSFLSTQVDMSARGLHKLLANLLEKDLINTLGSSPKTFYIPALNQVELSTPNYLALQPIDIKGETKILNKRIYVVLLNSDNDILLYKDESASDEGYWDVFGMYQRLGQDSMQTASRILSEYLGINAPVQLGYEDIISSSAGEEYIQVFFTIHNGPYGFDKNLVTRVKPFNLDLLKKSIQHYEEVSPLVFRFLEVL